MYCVNGNRGWYIHDGSLFYGGREVHSHFAFPVSCFSFPVSRFSFPVSRFVALIRYLEVHSYLHFPFRVSRFPFRVFRFLVHFTIVRVSFHVSRFPFSAASFAFCVSCFAFSVTLHTPYALLVLSISATTTHRRPIHLTMRMRSKYLVRQQLHVRSGTRNWADIQAFSKR